MKCLRAAVYLLSFMLIGCSYSTTVEGRVVDENNKPIENASILIIGKGAGGVPQEDKTFTDRDGRFYLESNIPVPHNAANSTVLLKISADGYSSYQTAIPHGVNTKGLKIECKSKRGG